MEHKHRLLTVGFAALLASVLPAQVNLNRTPTRILGHAQLALTTNNPNLVEGRELNGAQGIAIDASASPPILYVADTLNHRILAWRDAGNFENGAAADAVIGQRDFRSTIRGGPGTGVSTGLTYPSALIVDKRGNLYVVDSANNRILRFPQPFSRTDPLPNLVIGQTSFNGNQPNAGGISARTLVTGLSSVFGSSMAFDAQDNLWVIDPGNHRVLRYPASALTDDAPSGPAANLVLGQFDFASQTGAPATAEGQRSKTQFLTPSGLAFDPSGRLFVSDRLNRVLVFEPPFGNGKAATRIMGVIVGSATTQTCQQLEQSGQTNDTCFLAPEGVFMFDNQPGIADVGHNRILIFPRYEDWQPESTLFSPRALGSIGALGQDTISALKANRGRAEPAADSFRGPTHVAVTAGELFVADTGNNRVVVYSRNLLSTKSSAVRVLGQLDFAGGAPNLVEGREFYFTLSTTQGLLSTGGIVVDSSSDPPHLYVADSFNNRVLGFRDARKIQPGQSADLVIGQPDLRHTITNYPSNSSDTPNDQGLSQPNGLALDSQGNLYVADSGNGRVLRFSKPFAEGATNFPKANLVLGQSGFFNKISDATASTMAFPFGLAFAGDNGLLVSDTVHNRVVLFRGNSSSFTNGMSADLAFGQPDLRSSVSGAGDNNLNGPRHIATDTDDRLYVADSGNNRVQIFNRAPSAGANPRAATSLTQVTQGSGLRTPSGLFVSSFTGEIWVTELGTARIARYPRFDDLILNNNLTNYVLALPSVDRTGTVATAVTVDAFENLYYTDSTNRVAVHFPAVLALNGANELPGRALAPGTIAVACFPKASTGLCVYDGLGSKFAPEFVVNSGTTWPPDLNDVEVLFAGVPAPMYYVHPEKLAFQVPSSAPSSGTTEIEVIRKSTGQVLGAGTVAMDRISPGLFTSDSSGRGQIAALNEDNSVNGASNPIGRGQVIQLFGTGQGPVPNGPADGQPSSGVLPRDGDTRVLIGTGDVPRENILYSGLAPGFVGLWQVNVKIPDSVPPGTQIPCVVVIDSVANTIQGFVTTIAVKQ